MFAKALLIYGPYPPTGWTVSRHPDKSVAYVTGRGKAARAFQGAVVNFFLEDVKKRYSNRTWSDYHKLRVAMRWKNAFHLWVWEKIDEDS